MRIEKEHNANLKKGNRELGERIDDLTNKLKEQAEKEDRIVENFQQEIRAQTKLADVYKGIPSSIMIHCILFSKEKLH